MITKLTPESIANDVQMRRSGGHADSFIIVESDDDQKLYGKFADSACQIIPAWKRERAYDAGKVLHGRNCEGFLVLIDADYDRVIGPTRANEWCLYTDMHDLEVMLLSSPALDQLLHELASHKKLGALALTVDGVREHLLRLGAEIGRLRCASIKHALNLDFKNMDYKKFVCAETMTLDTGNMLTHIFGKNNLSHEQRLLCAKAYDGQTITESSEFCQGHDGISLLGMGLRKCWGSQGIDSVLSDLLTRELRLAYQWQHFMETSIYGAIREWEERNAPFRVFAIVDGAATA